MNIRQALQDSRERWRGRQIQTGIYLEESESEIASEDMDVNIYSVSLEGTMDIEENLESEQGEEPKSKWRWRQEKATIRSCRDQQKKEDWMSQELR